MTFNSLPDETVASNFENRAHPEAFCCESLLPEEPRNRSVPLVPDPSNMFPVSRPYLSPRLSDVGLAPSPRHAHHPLAGTAQGVCHLDRAKIPHVHLADHLVPPAHPVHHLHAHLTLSSTSLPDTSSETLCSSCCARPQTRPSSHLWQPCSWHLARCLWC